MTYPLLAVHAAVVRAEDEVLLAGEQDAVLADVIRVGECGDGLLLLLRRELWRARAGERVPIGATGTRRGRVRVQDGDCGYGQDGSDDGAAQQTKGAL